MSTASRLWLGFGTLLVLLLLTVVVAAIQLGDLETNLTTLGAARDSLASAYEQLRLVRGTLVLLLLGGSLIGIGTSVMVARGILRVERRLRRQREEFRVTLASIGDGVVATDAAGIVTFLNTMAQHLIGGTRGQCVGLPIEEVFHTIDEHTRQPAGSSSRQAMQHDGIAGNSVPALLVARDGRERPVEARAAAIRDHERNLLGSVLVFRDVTRRRLAEAALQESEQRFRTMADTAPVLIWLAGKDGNYSYFNKPWLDFRGRTLEEELGAGWAEGILAEDRERCLQTYQDALAGRQPFQMEYRLRRADGQYRSVLDSGVPRFGPDGSFAGYVGSCIDISEWRQAQDERDRIFAQEQVARHFGEAAERRYRDLVDGLDAIVWEADARTRQYTFVSRRAEEMLGYSVSQWLQRPGFWASIIHPEDRESTVKHCEAETTNGRDYDVEYRALTSDGRVVWFRDIVYVVKDEQHQPQYLRGVMTDVTQRRSLEEEQQRRAGELTEASRRKDAFLAVLAHELRNPLAPICNALHMLRLSRLDDPMVVEARSVLERQVTHLTGMVDDLLDVFRITHEKLSLHLEPLDLVKAVLLAVGDYQSAFQGLRVSLAADLPDSPVWVLADRQRLTQMLTNLLNNAAKFCAAGGVVTVRVTADAATSRAHVAVRDTGIGIEPAMLPHVFEVFTQADQGLDRTHGGLGLGLPLVKGLVELHGGEVEATSAGPGRGSEITFWIPLAASPAVAPSKPTQTPPDTPAEPALRILIVEDNQDTARTLNVLLTRYGHEVNMVHSGPAGVAAATSLRPDVVLCDLGLPGMDGYEVAHTLREDPANARLRMIAVSGYGREEDKRRSQAAGFDLHLTKPVDPIDLQRLLAVMARPSRIGSEQRARA